MIAVIQFSEQIDNEFANYLYLQKLLNVLLRRSCSYICKISSNREIRKSLTASGFSRNIDTIEAFSEPHENYETNDIISLSQMNGNLSSWILSNENRRLLPNSANGIHILEGTHNR